MLLGITGCGTKKDDGKIKVEIGNWAAETADPAVLEKLDKEVAEFEKLHPDIEIKGNAFGYDTKTFNVMASSGQLPETLDTFFTEMDQIIKSGYAADVTDALKENGLFDQLNPDVLEIAADKNGRVFGFPKEAYAIGLVINKKLFKEAGLVEANGTPKIPQTYAELAEYSKIIKEKTGKAGFVLPTTENGGGWVFMNIAWSKGVEFEEQQSDGSWKAVFDTPQFKEAIQYVKDLKWKYDALPDNKVINIEEQRKIFGIGQAAMTLASPDIVNTLVSKYGMNKDDVYFARVPGDSAGRYAQMGGAITIFSAANTDKQHDAAIKWLMFKGRTPVIDKDTEAMLRSNFETAISDGGVVFPKEFFTVWLSEERNKKYEEIAAEYANVDMANYEDYAGFKDVTLRPEESACCQQLYAVLDGVIQAVITDKDANIDSLTKTAVNDFQKNHLDKMN